MVFGPINSRRFGISLGVDLSPLSKSCNFDCIYCELTAQKPTNIIPNPPSVKQIVNEVTNALKIHSNTEVITLTANGEPTLYPNLKELVSELNLIKRDKKLLILSNGTGVLKDEVCDALMDIDIVKFSLDSAVQKTFKKIDRGSKEILVDELVTKMAEFRCKFKGELVLEVLVVAGLNDTLDEFRALNLAINRIAPHRVDISSIDRPPAYPVKGVSSKVLHELSAQISGIPVVVVTTKNINEQMDFSKDEILQMLLRRPQSEANVADNFSQISKQNLAELLADDKIYKTQVAGVSFYRVKNL
ncbi:radical SAM protein [Campylobacter sp. faydin G-140]|uniref:radical SAM protein n=1 Tax=Campylobacter anatolicus TaxID=2829105 RepID=UPI001B9BF489|nr:radical SAM protein [Campylobacter anatolicus]